MSASSSENLAGRNFRALIILGIALAAGFAASSFHFEGLSEAGRLTLGVFTTAALLWMLEPFPLYVTSFIVVILEVVLLGRPGGPLGLEGKGYTIFLAPFFDPVIVLLLGGFAMATAVKKYGLDEVISRRILGRVGNDPKIVLLGIMCTSALLSMWLSNTATTALMIAVAIPIIRSLPPDERFRKAIILGIPFACNIGGMGTPIGTPPNAIAMGVLENIGVQVSFLQWMLRGIPLVILLLAVSWVVLCKLYPPGVSRIHLTLKKKQRLGGSQVFVLIVFAVVVLLWLTSGRHGVPSAIISLIPVVLLFGFRLLGDNDLEKLGWGILFIVGGGMSLGVAMRESGLSAWLVQQIPFEGLSPFLIILLFAMSAAVMTTFISNSATANLLIPIVIGVSAIAPGMSAIVVALAASTAMILPVSTPPNAIAYGSGYVSMREMARAGLLITGIATALIPAFIYAVF
jgi:sodium-dependent dicarboxylate transporter 2/3/5